MKCKAEGCAGELENNAESNFLHCPECGCVMYERGAYPPDRYCWVHGYYARRSKSTQCPKCQRQEQLMVRK